MSVATPPDDPELAEGDPLHQAVGLLSQQTWCWGRDILRPEGNWLLEIGFRRIKPPDDRENCASVYSLQLPEQRCVVLRGFGVFYGDHRRGGVFLPRYEFAPRYSTESTLRCPPWTDDDLPSLEPPNESQRNDCVALTLDLIDWIRSYEVTIVKRLGISYRRSTLERWNNGKRLFTPAEKFASAWRELSFQVAANFDVFSGPKRRWPRGGFSVVSAGKNKVDRYAKHSINTPSLERVR